MICRRCGTPNLEAAVYCASCGRPLLRGPRPGRKSLRPLLLVAGGAAALAILYFLYMRLVPGPRGRAAPGTQAEGESVTRPVHSADGSLLPTFGEVMAHGSSGQEVFRTAAAVFGGAWVALPVAALLGAEDVVFQADGSAAVRITAGTWASGDPVVFWKVESGYTPAAIELAAWNPSLPLDWHPSRSADPPLRVEVGASRRAGSFSCFPAPPDIRHSGFFSQAGAIVGWTFDEPFDQAYLWAGVPAAGSPPAIESDRFFSVASADCREGYFRRLLESGTGITPSAELEALARGFRLAPLLASEDLPPELRQSAIVDRMDSVAAALIESGQGDEVVRIVDDRTIRESADPVLARVAVLALAGKQDFNRTIRRLETIERDIFMVRGPVPAELSELKLLLYKDWLRKIIEKGDYYSGAVAFEEARRAFPDDPEIRLLGVEIALTDNDPDRARELLEGRDYPPALKDWADELERELAGRPEEEEDTIIRFDPDQDHIPVEAVLNGFFTQKFAVDTGSTFVTIPSSAAAALKIKFDEGIPARAVATASGVQIAYEVTLGSIRLADCEVANVKALVMDMPAMPEYGLLGLSFLNAFSAEIDKTNGVLRLKKRPK